MRHKAGAPAWISSAMRYNLSPKPITWPVADNAAYYSVVSNDALWFTDSTAFGTYELSATPGGATALPVMQSSSSIDVTGTTTPLPPDPLAAVDTTTRHAVSTSSQTYTGPVSGLPDQYINVTSASLNVSSSTPDGFINTGSGTYASAVGSGTNVLDGGTGSNFLTGGSGTDTSFVDAPAAPADFRSTAPGGPTASLTLAGSSQPDLGSGAIALLFGTDSGSGNSYM